MKTQFALIVEDDPDIAVFFSEALRDAGFEVDLARTGDAALVRLAASVPDVVVLDLHLPNVSGTDILRQIRADARLAGVRIIVASADSSRAEELREQADLVLVKPISFNQLRDLAARLLRVD